MEAAAGLSIIMRVFGALLPTIAGWFYTEKKLDALIDIQTLVSGDCFTGYNSSHRASCYLSITNLTPFHLTIDRIEIKAIFNGGSAILHQIIPHQIGQAGKISIYTEDVFSISPEGLEIAKKTERIRLEVIAYVTSRARNLIVRRTIDYIKNFSVH